MLVLLSPAKTFNETTYVPFEFPVRTPHFASDTQELVKKLTTMSTADLAELLEISEKLAQVNFERYQAWSPNYTSDNSRPAAFSFWGDVNKNLDAFTLSQAELEYADQHLLFLSGLYGVLRPLDFIQTYRLEMGVPFATSASCKNLYQYWGKKVVEYLNERIAAENIDLICNLASKEYFSVVDFKKLNAPSVEIVFKDQKNGKHKVIAVIAKRSRGLFARWIVQNNITTKEQLKTFNVDGYYFKADESNDSVFTFYRDEA